MAKRTQLGNQYAEAALKDKRAVLLGEIHSLEKQLSWKRHQLELVTGTLQVFGVEAGTKSVKRYERVHLFKQGELCRRIRDALRESGKPMSGQAVTEAVCAAMGHGESAYPAMKRRIDSSLRYMWKDRREVVKAGAWSKVTWRLR